MNDELHNKLEYTDEINLLQILQILAQHKTIIIRLCLGAALLSLCISLLFSNTYTATARLIPPQKDSTAGLSTLLSQAGGMGAITGGIAFSNSTDLYIGILKSRSVADAVIKKLDLQHDFSSKTLEEARKKLETNVKFQAGKDGIITISADSKIPVKAALLANTFVEELSRRTVQLNLTKFGAERIFLEKRIEVVKKDLQNAENDMKIFQEKYKTIKADSQATAAIEGIAKLKAELAFKEVQLAALRNSMTEENSEVKTVKAAIANIKGQLQNLSGSGGIDVIPSVGNAPGLGVDYFRKLRELKIQEAIFEQLTKQYEIAKLNEARDSSSLQVLDEAVAPVKKSKPRRLLIMFFSTVTAFFISIFIIFIKTAVTKLPEEDLEMMRDIKRTLFSLGGG